MRRAYLLAFVIAAMLLSAAPLAAQCQMQFNISFYIDGSVSDDLSTVYGYGNYVDIVPCADARTAITERSFDIRTGRIVSHEQPIGYPVERVPGHRWQPGDVHGGGHSVPLLFLC